jgi:phage/plasmid-like protein (TIGR03299 family)
MVANVQTMAYVEKAGKPWHGLGNAISDDLTVEEMQEAAGANFEVLKEPEFVRFNGREIKTGNFALLRKNAGKEYVQFLDSVSDGWVYPQPAEAFEFFREWIGKEMHFDTAGVLDNGRMIWVMAKTNDGFSLFNGKDHIESNLLFSVPYRYGKSTTVCGTAIRVVCENTLQMALQAAKEDMIIRINHRREVDPEEIKNTLKLNRAKLNTFKEAAEFLSKKKAKADQVQEYFDELFPLTSNKKGKEHSRNSERLVSILETQPGAKLGAGTWWQAFNAVTYSTDHLIGNNDDTRMFSAFYGVGRKRKTDALKLAVEYAKTA